MPLCPHCNGAIKPQRGNIVNLSMSPLPPAITVAMSEAFTYLEGKNQEDATDVAINAADLQNLLNEAFVQGVGNAIYDAIVDKHVEMREADMAWRVA